MQPLEICIGPTIRIGRESWCLPYAGFLHTKVAQLHSAVAQWQSAVALAGMLICPARDSRPSRH